MIGQAVANPFATRWTRPGAIPFLFAGGECAGDLIQALARNGWRGAIVGGHGTGKSTLVAALLPELTAAGRRAVVIQLHDGERRLPISRGELRALDSDSVLIVDGYEQLGPWQRWSLRMHCQRRGIGLLVTAHRPCGLPIVYRTRIELATLAELIERWLPPDGGVIRSAEIERAFARHAGNVRETFFELYDVFEARRGVAAE